MERKVYISVIAVVLLLVCIIPLKASRGGDLQLERSFQVAPGGSLKVEAPGSDIKVTGWDKNEVLVKIFGDAEIKQKYSLELEQSGNDVELVLKKKGSFISKMFNISSENMRIEVKVPVSYNAGIETAGGDIYASSFNGDVKLKTAGGNIHALNITGSLSSSTAGGDIKMDHISGTIKCATSGGEIFGATILGDINAVSTGGDIELAVKDGMVKAVSTGGDVTLNYLGENRGMSLASTGGDINMIIDSGVKASMLLVSMGGEITCDLPTSNVRKISHIKFDADVNGGGPEIKVTSTGGDVTIRSK